MEHERFGLPYVLTMEFRKLKDEQIQRIKFRDDMVHVHLLAVGAVFGWALSHPKYITLILIIPWICFVLGWTYIANDDKISAIGCYIRRELDAHVRASISTTEEVVFRWELAHRLVEGRHRHKIWQFAVDLTAFVLSGFLAIVVAIYYLALVPRPEPKLPPDWLVAIPIIIELVMLIMLGREFYAHAEFHVID